MADDTPHHVSSAYTALQEAVAALGAGELAEGRADDLTDDARYRVASGVADVLDATVALLRAVEGRDTPGRDANTTPSERILGPLVEPLSEVATRARNVQHPGDSLAAPVPTVADGLDDVSDDSWA